MYLYFNDYITIYFSFTSMLIKDLIALMFLKNVFKTLCSKLFTCSTGKILFRDMIVFPMFPQFFLVQYFLPTENTKNS